MGEPLVHLAHEGPISTLTIARPEVLNALNVELLVALKRAIEEVRGRSAARCLIVTGAGTRAFAAGADIAEMKGFGPPEARAFALKGQAAMAALEALPLPAIAAVQGVALGGGCELALACDFIYAAEDARFGQPEVNLGVVPGFGGTQRLARRVGLGQARELIYSGRIIDATEALRIGLVNRVLPGEQLLRAAHETAQAIANKAPVAIRHAKRVIGEGVDNALSDGNELELEAFVECFKTEDRAEGMRAFLEKRGANFRGL